MYFNQSVKLVLSHHSWPLAYEYILHKSFSCCNVVHFGVRFLDEGMPTEWTVTLKTAKIILENVMLCNFVAIFRFTYNYPLYANEFSLAPSHSRSSCCSDLIIRLSSESFLIIKTKIGFCLHFGMTERLTSFI